MTPRQILVLIVLVVSVILGLSFASSCYQVVEPGQRGVAVSFGKLQETALPEGFHWKAPWTTVHLVNVRQATKEVKAECFSSDLQTVTIMTKIMYRTPENSVIKVYAEYTGDPFDSLVAPRVQEALKEATAQESAESIVKKREEIKDRTITLAQKKLGNILKIDDIVIENVDLSNELEKAIEEKMVQEQETKKMVFTKEKAQLEADTALIKAKGEANAMNIRGDAIKNNAKLIELEIVQKWDGKAPQVISGTGAGGANMIFPIGKTQ